MAILTREEAAGILKISVRSLDRRIAKGNIRVFKLGDSPNAPVRIADDELQAYLSKHIVTTPDTLREHAKAIIEGKRNS